MHSVIRDLNFISLNLWRQEKVIHCDIYKFEHGLTVDSGCIMYVIIIYYDVHDINMAIIHLTIIEQS